MRFLHRYLSEDLTDETLADSICKLDCNELNEYSGDCQLVCVKVCPKICRVGFPGLSPPVTYRDHKNSKKLSIISASAIVSAILLACLIIIFFKSRSRSRSRSRSSRLQFGTNDDTGGEFLDEDHGPIIDHPIWYIRTVGLQPSVINSISVFKYKKGEGLVDGTDCSVCLTEFQEDETLRLLPKCSHAFHVPCIDTWLRLHVNCPLCRAPIIVNAETSSSGANNTQTRDEIHVVISEESRENDEEMERNNQEIEEHDCEAEEDEMKRVRRSVSLDSLSAQRLSEAVVYASEWKESNSRERENAENIKRSVSCSGKFHFPRYV